MDRDPLAVFETLVRQGQLTGLAPEPRRAQRTVTERLAAPGPQRCPRPIAATSSCAPSSRRRRSRRQGARCIAGWHGIARRNVSTATAMSDSCAHQGPWQSPGQTAEATRELMLHHIVQEYETPTQKNKQSVYCGLTARVLPSGACSPRATKPLPARSTPVRAMTKHASARTPGADVNRAMSALWAVPRRRDPSYTTTTRPPFDDASVSHQLVSSELVVWLHR